jgi:hypothetical protein
MRPLKLSLASALLLVGCSQLLGLGDYEIDKTLDGDSSPGGAADGGSSGKNASGGKTSDAGKTSAEAGDGPVSNGGKSNDTGGTSGTGNASAGEGGDPPAPQGGKGGTGPVDEGGAGGEGGAPAPAPELIPCDSVTCCTSKGGKPDAGVELLTDGGFELGTAEQGDTPWTESSTNDSAVITDGGDEATPHAGQYFAWLGGLPDETSIVQSPTFTVPSDAGWLVTSGYRRFQIDSDDTDGVNDDLMTLSLWNPAADKLTTLLQYWDKDDPGGTTKWTRFEVSVSAEDDAGKERYFMALGSTDDHLTSTDILSSNYMLDDLSLKAYRCYK